ncbi:hypothetical protein PHISP_00391 [Aspergillus sp. HF37]|nr:hypothetical protein PHISP_00391 [Aspergillus sp. HF37]
MATTGAAPAIAVIAGSFLSGNQCLHTHPQPHQNKTNQLGAMMNVFLLTVPAVLETTTEPGQLLRHWRRIFLNGHVKGPAICLTTTSLYAIAAVGRYLTGDAWLVFAAAGLSTIGMVPFTLTLMQPTNSALFRLEGDARKGSVAAWRDVEQLVRKWNRLNAVRALFPLAGAALGMLGSLGVIAF